MNQKRGTSHRENDFELVVLKERKDQGSEKKTAEQAQIKKAHYEDLILNKNTPAAGEENTYMSLIERDGKKGTNTEGCNKLSDPARGGRTENAAVLNSKTVLLVAITAGLALLFLLVLTITALCLAAVHMNSQLDYNAATTRSLAALRVHLDEVQKSLADNITILQQDLMEELTSSVGIINAMLSSLRAQTVDINSSLTAQVTTLNSTQVTFRENLDAHTTAVSRNFTNVSNHLGSLTSSVNSLSSSQMTVNGHLGTLESSVGILNNQQMESLADIVSLNRYMTNLNNGLQNVNIYSNCRQDSATCQIMNPNCITGILPINVTGTYTLSYRCQHDISTGNRLATLEMDNGGNNVQCRCDSTTSDPNTSQVCTLVVTRCPTTINLT